MEIPLGMQMAIKAFAKLFGFDPKLMIANLELMGKSLHSVADDMARIRRQNDAIMAHLKIQEIDNGEDEHALRSLDGERRSLNGSGRTPDA